MDKHTRRFYPLEQNPSLNENEIHLGDVTQVPRRGKAHGFALAIIMLVACIPCFVLVLKHSTFWLIPFFICAGIGLRASIKPKH